tara:strand:+ start:6480 stop:7199 length:720 start_codon:yes stop_codon:yes gene_type:complete
MNQNNLRFYIATDGTAMQKAEMALVYSIQKVCSVPFSVHFMDKHRPDPLWHGWNDKKWYTPFSNFRFAIPEVNGFQGRAVYMDVDQIVLKDPKELFELEIPEDKAWLALDANRTDVMLMDCAKFKNIANWPSIEEQKQSNNNIGHYVQKIKDCWSPLPKRWCCNDGGIASNQGNKIETDPYDPETTCLMHYTQMNWQPWKPYPEKFKYPPHPHARAESLWWQMYAGALESKINFIKNNL